MRDNVLYQVLRAVTAIAAGIAASIVVMAILLSILFGLPRGVHISALVALACATLTGGYVAAWIGGGQELIYAAGVWCAIAAFEILARDVRIAEGLYSLPGWIIAFAAAEVGGWLRARVATRRRVGGVL